MATKIIKLTNGTNTYLPITTADAVQYRTSGTPISVQAAIEQVAGAVLPIADDVTTNGNYINSIAISYSTTNGIVLSNNKNGGSNIKLQGTNGITVTYTGTNGVLKIEGHSDVQHVEGNVTSNVAYIKLESDGGKVGLRNDKVNTDLYSNITFSYTNNQDIRIGIAYTYPTITNLGANTGYTVATITARDTKSSSALYVPRATNSDFGVVKLGYSDANKGYALKLDSNGKAYVNVPWTDNNDSVKSAARSTTVTYLIGVSGTLTNQQTPKHDGNTYLTPTAGDLYSKTIHTTTPGSTDNSTLVPTTAWVNSAIGNKIGELVGALIYKGTLGTGGTKTDFTAAPTQSELGYVYVVKTAGNYSYIDVNIDGTNETNADKKHLEPGDYVIATWNGSSYVWSAINGENQIEDYTTAIKVGSGSKNIAMVDGTYLTINIEQQDNVVTKTTTNFESEHIILGSSASTVKNSSYTISNGAVPSSTTAVPTWKGLNDYINGKSYVSSNDTLTSDVIILGNGTKTVKVGNSYTISNVLTNTNTTQVPTSQAINNYIGGLGYLKSSTQSKDFGKIANNATNFKDVTTYVAPGTTASTATADENQDTLNIWGANYWIRTSISDTNGDSISIGHSLAAGANKAKNLYTVAIDPAGHSYNPTAQGKETIAIPTSVNISGLSFVEGKTVTDLDSDWLTGALGAGYNTSYSPTGTLSTTATTHQYWYYQ